MEINIGHRGLKEKFNELPGFRFHPTEQELVGFYLKRMVQGKLHNFNFILMLDLYRYDPWDLPNFATLGERELFFFVPRDERCQNNRGRPNRLTASGYWKATGSDRFVRDDNAKCIGLKKTLVFYRGRAPRGQKTDWIMNEYKLPDYFDQPKTEVVLCRIYKKAIPLKWLEEQAMNQAEVTSTCEDLDCISQDSPLSPANINDKQRVQEAKSICLRDSDSVACDEFTPEPSSSLQDNVTHSDITSFLDCAVNWSLIESSVCEDLINPDFPAFADDCKRIEGFLSPIGLPNSSSSPSSTECCCGESLLITEKEGEPILPQIPKMFVDFPNESDCGRNWYLCE